MHELLKPIMLNANLSSIHVFEKLNDHTLIRTNLFLSEGASDCLCHLVTIPLKEPAEMLAVESLKFVEDGVIAGPSFTKDISSACKKACVLAPVLTDGIFTGFILFCHNHQRHRWTEKERQTFGDLSMFLGELAAQKQAANHIAQSNAAMTTILDSLDALVYVVEYKTYKLLFTNAVLRSLLPVDALPDKTCWELFRPELGTICPYCVHDTLFDAHDKPLQTTLKKDCYHEAAGVWMEMNATPVRWIDGKNAVLMIFYDITTKKQIADTLQYKNELLALALRNARGFTWEMDIPSKSVTVSPTTEKSIGFKPHELSGSISGFMDMIHHSDRQVARQKFADYIQGEADEYAVEHAMYTADGSLKWFLAKGKCLDEKMDVICGISIDITEQKRYEEQLAERAYKDTLTGLYNMQYLTDNLLFPAIAHYRNLGAMILDVRGLKNINEAFGHQCGDQILIAIASKLKALVSSPVLRISGDRFLMLFNEATDSQMVTSAEDILAQFNPPLRADNRSVQVNLNIGIACSTGNAKKLNRLMRDAEIALYAAKKDELRAYCVFDNMLRTTFGNRVNMEMELQKAIRQEDFILYYQPKIHTQMKSIVGAEALIRWKHMEHGLIPPLDFIPLAEEKGQIASIGNFVIAEVTKQIRRWRDKGYDFFVSLNVSTKQFLLPDLAKIIKNWVEFYAIPPSSLAIEITESIMILDFQQINKTLTELREYGIRVLLDDFGTGYSSMNYLGKMPIDNIKIDKTLLDNALTNEKAQAILKTIILLAHDLNLLVTAEGVETEAQFAMLSELGCDIMQGYLFSEPLPPDQFEQKMNDWSNAQ